MLKVLLLILKILGFTLLGILGLVLLLLLVVLLSPIRYSVDASGKVPKVTAELGISWLLHIVSVKGGYYGEAGIGYKVKLFGITILPKKEDPDKPQKPKKPKKSKKPKKAKKPKKPSGKKDAGASQDGTAAAAGTEAGSAGTGDAGAACAAGSGTETEAAVETETPEKTREELIDEIVYSVPEEPDTPENRKKNRRKRRKAAKAGEPKPKKPPLKERLRGKWEAFLTKLRTKLRALQEKKEALEEKGDKLRNFLEDPANQKAFRLVKKVLLNLMKHYRPRMAKGHLTLGLSDPSLTGRLLAAYYGLLSKHYEDFQLYGEFEEEIIEGEFRMKGRIRPVHLAYAGIRLILNKTVRSWIKH